MLATSRRTFLRHLMFGQEPLVERAGADVLVCVFLRGGADTLSILVPYGDDRYYGKRPTLSVPHPSKGGDAAALKLDDFYALHPKMRPLLPAWSEGRLGAVQAVGTDNPTGSHFETQDQVERGEGYRKSVGGGWLGRHMRSRAGGAVTPLSAVAIGATVPEALRGAASASAFRSVEDIRTPGSSADPSAVAKALGALYGAEVGILGQQGRETLDLLRRVETLRGTAYRPEPGVTYPDDDFSRGLREIARLIKADVGLEVACIDLDGWDTHFFQGSSGGQFAGLVERLATGVAAFDADLRSDRDRVTTLVMTEFGRRLYENGSAGTDHGRGFAVMALGGKVNGGKVHGEWPGLEGEGNNYVGPGGLEVRVDYRSVLAEVLGRAAGGADVARVFPDFAPQHVGLIV